MVRTPIGVGFIGAGAVTQAIHLPTLARLGDRFCTRHVYDVDAEVAAEVAARVGARSTTALAELLEDTEVEVVAVCSPDRFHAEHVLAAIEAGARAVLCEKPFATDEADAREIAAAAARAGVPVVVGAMHTFDRSWIGVRDQLGPVAGSRLQLVRSSIVLPPNERFEDFATEVTGARLSPGGPAGAWDDERRAEMLRGMVLGLAIHDLPLVRRLLDDPAQLRIHDARLLDPLGYQIVAGAGSTRLELHASMGQPWRPDWRLEALGREVQVRLDFTPSYVLAGSGRGRVSDSRGTTVHGPFPTNGYEEEWDVLARILQGEQQAPCVEELVADLAFALAVAEGSRDHILRHHDEEDAA